MNQLNLQKSRRMAENWLDDRLREALAAQPDEERRRLTETLYARQKASMEYLSLVQLDMGKPAAEDPEEDWEPDRVIPILGSPWAGLLLAVLVLAFVLLKWQLAAVIAAIVLVLQCFLRATHPALRRRSTLVVPEVHEPYLLENDLARFLQRQTDRIAIDADSIAERSAVTLVRERLDVGEDAAELYCALREAALDVPDPEVLSYPLSILKMSLIERSLEPVDYTPATAAYFDVMSANCPDQMRCPAIRSRENGAVIKRGLYLRRQP